MKTVNNPLHHRAAFIGSTRSALVTVLLTLILVSACKQTGLESQDNQSKEPRYTAPVAFDLEAIKERGTLVALIDNSSTGYFIYRGRPMGFEYELLKRYADAIGVGLELRIVEDIDQAFHDLNSGVGDVLAYNLTVTKARKERVAFTQAFMQTRQVLVQRKPESWRTQKRHITEKKLLRNPIELIGKTVKVRKNSSHLLRLQHLSDEVGGDILILEGDGHQTTEDLIREVAAGELAYTVADENIAQVNATYFPDLDVKTALSMPTQIAWGLRKNAPELQASINGWLSGMRKKPDYNVIYRKYFKSPKASIVRVTSEFSSITGSRLSPYDDLIKTTAEEMGWEWTLLAAQMFQESAFDPQATSWAGAKGLMQLMPATGKQYGATDLYNVNQNVRAAKKFLVWLNGRWGKHIEDEDERIKFILASYNAGLGHVADARRLAEKYGADPNVWEEVAPWLLKKAQRKYYKDPVVKMGYCRGREPVHYVERILEIQQQYNLLLNIENEREKTLALLQANGR